MLCQQDPVLAAFFSVFVDVVPRQPKPRSSKPRGVPMLARLYEGQTFSGKQAAAQGLVTGLADSFSEALRSF